MIRYTQVGRGLRAVAENPRAARLMGLDVDRMIALTLVISSALGGLAGILFGVALGDISPYIGRDNVEVRGLAVIVLGGMGSVPGAVIGGYLLGFIEVLALVGAGQQRPRRRCLRRLIPDAGAAAARTVRSTAPREGLKVGMDFFIQLFTDPVGFWNSHTLLIAQIGINSILASSMFIVLYSGQLSLAAPGFMAIGAYTAVLMDLYWHTPLALNILVGVVLAGAVGVLVGLPVLRLRGVFLAIATIGFVEALRLGLILNLPITGEGLGLKNPTADPLGGINIVLASLAVVLFLMWRLTKGRLGAAWAAIRQDELAALSQGIHVARYKMIAFVLSAVLAGLAGGLEAHLNFFVDPGDQEYGVTRAVQILTFAVLGGSGHFMGPVVGALVVTSLPWVFQQAPDLHQRRHRHLPDRRDRLPAAGHRRPRRPRDHQAVVVAASRMSVLLRLDNVQRHFGGVHAVDGVSLEVEQGSIHGLIGPNGAGKTTLVNLVTGYVPMQSGHAWLQSDELTGLPAHRIAALGISRTFQNIRLFKDLTALENVLVGMHTRRRDDTLAQLATLPMFRRDQRGLMDDARGLMETVGLAASDIAGRAAGTLPYGDQRRLEIARALALETAPVDPRRAGGRYEPIRETGHARAHRAPQRRRFDHPAHRSRHAPGHGRLPASRRAGLRPQDR